MKKFLKFIFKLTLIASVIGGAVFFGGKKLLELDGLMPIPDANRFYFKERTSPTARAQPSEMLATPTNN